MKSKFALISSALLRIACLVILYKTCRVPDQELAADGVSGPVLGLALDYLTGHYHTGKDIHEVRPLNGLKAMPSEIT
jgi:hypothetical protein